MDPFDEDLLGGKSVAESAMYIYIYIYIYTWNYDAHTQQISTKQTFV